MAKTVTINLDINTKDGVKSLGDLDKEASETLKTLGEMEEAAEIINEELKNTEVGTKEYEKLRKELIKVNTEIKNQELAMEALDNEQVASELKSVAGGFVDMAGGMALVGAGNKSLEQVVQTMAQVEGATKIVTGAMEAYASVMKLSHTITTAVSAATKALTSGQVLMAVKTKIVTAATWLWNAAMAANPIGLIIAAIAAFVVGIAAMTGALGKVTDAFKKLMGIQTEAEKQNERIETQVKAVYKARLDGIRRVMREEKRAFDERQKLADQEIRMMEALGENSFSARKKMLEDAVNFQNQQIKLQQEITDVTIGEYNRRQKTAFKSEEEILQHFLKTGIKRRKASLASNVSQLIQLQKNIKDRKDLQFEAGEAEINLQKHITDQYKKELEKRKQAEQDRIDDATRIYEVIDRLEIEMMEESLRRDEMMRQFKFDQQIKDLNEAIPEQNRLIKLYEQQLQEDLYGIRMKWNKKSQKDIVQIEQQTQGLIFQQQSSFYEETMAEKVAQWQTANEAILNKISEGFEIASQTITGIFSLAQEAMSEQAEQATMKREAQYSQESEALKNQLANREISQEQYQNKLKLLDQKKQNEERAAARKAFQMDKAFRISQAVMGTAQAVISGLSAPFPLGVIMAGINAAMGAAQIGVIAAQKPKFNRGGIVPGSPSNVDSVDAMLAPGEAVINSSSTQAFAPLLSAINEAGGGRSLVPSTGVTQNMNQPVFPQNEKMQRVVVVESDITDTQRNVSRVEESASF